MRAAGGRAARRVAGHQRPRRRRRPGSRPWPRWRPSRSPATGPTPSTSTSPSARRWPSWSGRARGAVSTTTACCSAPTTSAPRTCRCSTYAPRRPPSALAEAATVVGNLPAELLARVQTVQVGSIDAISLRARRRHPDQLGERRRVGRQGRGAHAADASSRRASTTSPPPAAPPSPSNPSTRSVRRDASVRRPRRATAATSRPTRDGCDSRRLARTLSTICRHACVSAPGRGVGDLVSSSGARLT